MGDLIKKFAVFDIMGVWAPGSIFLLYSTITIIYLGNIDVISMLQEFQSDFSLIIIFLFCVSSYFFGVILHEIGKSITDLIKPFTLDTLFKYKSLKHLTIFQRRFVLLTNRIDKEKYANTDINVYEALDYIKGKNIQMNSIEKSRSIYGFSRSITVGFIVHLLFLSVYYYNLNKLFLGIDVTFSILFLLRTCRYYYVWIQKVFVCYDCLKNKETNNETH